jgi:hypothetical protein
VGLLTLPKGQHVVSGINDLTFTETIEKRTT